MTEMKRRIFAVRKDIIGLRELHFQQPLKYTEQHVHSLQYQDPKGSTLISSVCAILYSPVALN